jgi:hypothetical protein
LTRNPNPASITAMGAPAKRGRPKGSKDRKPIVSVPVPIVAGQPKTMFKAIKVRILDRRAKVWELVLAGVTGCRDITSALAKQGIETSKSTIDRDLHAAIAEYQALVAVQSAEAKAIELARLDRWTIAATRKMQAGSVPAGFLLVKLQERRAKLLGLDAPTKLAGADGGPIELVARASAEVETKLAQLSARLDQLTRPVPQLPPGVGTNKP